MNKKKKNLSKKNSSEDSLSGKEHRNPFSRRAFLHTSVAGTAALAFSQFGCSSGKPKQATQDIVDIQGFDELSAAPDPYAGWKPFSERKVKVGLVGYGRSKFGTSFGFQNHPNVEVVAVSDLIPDRCAEMAKVSNCSKTYPSLEELVRDKEIEAVFVATDAPNHMQHSLEVLKHGKHVAVAVPAVLVNWFMPKGSITTIWKSLLIHIKGGESGCRHSFTRLTQMLFTTASPAAASLRFPVWECPAPWHI